MNRLKGITPFLVASFLVVSISTTHAKFQDDYDQAYEFFKSAPGKENRAEAARRFEALSQRDDAGSLKANCLYWSGECWYDLKQYPRALGNFERVLLYPRSNKEEHSRFKVAMCCVRLGWKESAQWELGRFLAEYPSSSLAKVVKNELDKLKTAP